MLATTQECMVSRYGQPWLLLVLLLCTVSDFVQLHQMAVGQCQTVLMVHAGHNAALLEEVASLSKMAQSSTGMQGLAELLHTVR